MTVKRYWFFTAAVTILAIVLSAGLGRIQDCVSAAGSDTVEREKRLQIIIEEKEFKLYKISDAMEGEKGYIARVFLNEVKAVYEEQLPKRGKYQPRVKLFNDGINASVIEIRQYGCEKIFFCRYYDRESNRVSPVYANVLTSGYGKVVFSMPGRIIVTDTFDNNAFYKEFVIEDLPATTKPSDAFLELLWSGPEGLVVTYAVNSGEVLTARTIYLDLAAPAAKVRETQRIDDSWRLVKRAKEYQVFIGFDKLLGSAMYVVLVYDDEGNIVNVSSYPVSRLAPSVTMLDNDIVEMTIGVGTGARYTHYCDRKTRRKSPVYYSPRLVGYGKVVAPKIGKLVVSDMFGEGLFYKELIIEEFPPMANPVDAFSEIKWVGENKLSVTYLIGNRGEKFGKKTVEFDLNE